MLFFMIFGNVGTVSLLQGSGTYAVEAVIQTTTPREVGRYSTHSFLSKGGGSKVQFVPSGRGIQVHFVTNKMGGGGEGGVKYSLFPVGGRMEVRYKVQSPL